MNDEQNSTSHNASAGPHPQSRDVFWKECYLAALAAVIRGGWDENVSVAECVEAAIEFADASIARIRGDRRDRTVPLSGADRPLVERPGSEEIGAVKIHTTR